MHPRNDQRTAMSWALSSASCWLLLAQSPTFGQSVKALEVYNLGVAATQKGDLQGAYGLFTRAIRLKPFYAPALHNRAVVSWQLRDEVGAWKDLEAAIKANPKDPLYHQTGGFFHTSKKEWSKAIDEFSKAIELKPDFAEAYQARAAAKSQAGNQKGAIEDFSIAIKNAPRSPGAYEGRAACRKKANDLAGAIEDYRQALKLNPGDQRLAKAVKEAEAAIK